MNAPGPAPAGRHDRRALFCVVLFATALLLHLWCLSRGWRAPILDAHEFRQVQTATTALFFQQDGLKLDYDTPILGPPWSIPMELPTYQAVVALMARGTGLPLEQAGRLVSATAFYVALAGIFLLLGRWLPACHERLVPLAFILISPLYLYYSRCFLIESTVLAFSVWFLWAFLRWMDRPAPGRLAAVWVLGALASTTKITTFTVFAVPAAAATLQSLWVARREPLGRRFRPAALGLLAISVPLAAAVAWVVHSDQVKAQNPLAGFLLSSSLREFNFGTLHQRLSREFWIGIGTVTERVALGAGAMFLLGTAFFAVSAEFRRRATACLVFFAGGFLVFANLYYVHDYYFYASSVFLLAAAGLLAVGLLRQPALGLPAVAVLILLALANQYTRYEQAFGTFLRGLMPAPPPMAALVRELVPPQDVVLVFGRDWSGRMAYYSQRRTITMPDHLLRDPANLQRSLAHLGGRRVAAAVFAGPLRNSPYFIRSRLAGLDLDGQPIAEAPDMTLCLRTDLLGKVPGALAAAGQPELRSLQHLDRPITDPLHELGTPEWRAKLAGFGTLPYAVRSPYAPNQIEEGGVLVLNTHAPSELLISPPAGARTIRVECGLLRSAYTGTNRTDGVVFEICEERTDGSRRFLLRRSIDPVNNPEDRGPLQLEATSEVPIEGVLVCRVDPGPGGNVNCDWAYWQSCTVR